MNTFGARSRRVGRRSRRVTSRGRKGRLGGAVEARLRGERMRRGSRVSEEREGRVVGAKEGEMGSVDLLDLPDCRFSSSLSTSK